MEKNHLMKNKRGYLKTTEAIIAIVISFLFVAFFLPPERVPSDIDVPKLDMLKILEQNPGFRNCIMDYNYSCLDTTFESYYPNFNSVYEYRFNISTDPKLSGTELPTADIHIESLFIAGNDTYLYPRTLRLYYWFK